MGTLQNNLKIILASWPDHIEGNRISTINTPLSGGLAGYILTLCTDYGGIVHKKSVVKLTLLELWVWVLLRFSGLRWPISSHNGRQQNADFRAPAGIQQDSVCPTQVLYLTRVNCLIHFAIGPIIRLIYPYYLYCLNFHRGLDITSAFNLKSKSKSLLRNAHSTQILRISTILPEPQLIPQHVYSTTTVNKPKRFYRQAAPTSFKRICNNVSSPPPFLIISQKIYTML